MGWTWEKVSRPGYFGRRRDAIVADLNRKYGQDNWTLLWCVADEKRISYLMFPMACRMFYERSYIMWFERRPGGLDELERLAETYGDCIDNAPTNVQSGLDYTKQEAFSTHIQDIAMRNVMKHFGLAFHGPADKLLVIRSADSEGYIYGPGNVPFYDRALITQPSLRPGWAGVGSVEDFWQSNKWIAVRRD